MISWLQNRPVEEVRGWLKRANDQGDFPLSNRLSIRYFLCLRVSRPAFKLRKKLSNGSRSNMLEMLP